MIRQYYQSRIGTPPKRHHKYYRINDDFRDCLRKNYLYLSSFGQLNDVHEGKTDVVNFDPNFEQLSDLVEKHHPNALTPEQIKYFMGLEGKMDELRDEFRLALIEARDSQRICCFSTINTNDILWATYTDSHQGVCLTFEFPGSATNFYTLEVDYVPDFTQHDYFDTENDAMLFMLLAC